MSEIKTYLANQKERCESVINAYNEAVDKRDKAQADKEEAVKIYTQAVEEAQAKVDAFTHIESIVSELDTLNRLLASLETPAEPAVEETKATEAEAEEEQVAEPIAVEDDTVEETVEEVKREEPKEETPVDYEALYREAIKQPEAHL